METDLLGTHRLAQGQKADVMALALCKERAQGRVGGGGGHLGTSPCPLEGETRRKSGPQEHVRNALRALGKSSARPRCLDSGLAVGLSAYRSVNRSVQMCQFVYRFVLCLVSVCVVNSFCLYQFSNVSFLHKVVTFFSFRFSFSIFSPLCLKLFKRKEFHKVTT